MIEKLISNMKFKNFELEQENQKMKEQLACLLDFNIKTEISTEVTKKGADHVVSHYERALVEVLKQGKDLSQIMCLHATLRQHDVERIKAIIVSVG